MSAEHLLLIGFLVLVLGVFFAWRRFATGSGGDPTFEIIPRNSDAAKKLQQRLGPIDRKAFDLGFFPQLDFFTTVGRQRFVCRSYLNGETYVVLIVMTTGGLASAQMTLDLISSFSDNSHLFTTNSLLFPGGAAPAGHRIQRKSVATSLEACYESHVQRLHEVANSGIKATYDKHQGLFRFLQARFDERKGSVG